MTLMDSTIFRTVPDEFLDPPIDPVILIALTNLVLLFVLIFHSVALFKRTDATFRSRFFRGFNTVGACCLLSLVVAKIALTKRVNSPFVLPIAAVATIFMIIGLKSGSNISADTVTCISGCMVGLSSAYFLAFLVIWIFRKMPTAHG